MSLVSEPETHGEHVGRTSKLAAEQKSSAPWSVPSWPGTGERAVKTAAQALVATLTVSTGAELIPAVGLGGINWLAVASVTSAATVLSIGTSIGNADFTVGRGRSAPTTTPLSVDLTGPGEGRFRRAL